MKPKSSEYDRFNEMMGKLIKVSHSELKATLDAEKQAKKKRKTKRASSGRASGGKD